MSTQNSGLSSEFVEALFWNSPQAEICFGVVDVSVVMQPCLRRFVAICVCLHLHFDSRSFGFYINIVKLILCLLFLQ